MDDLPERIISAQERRVIVPVSDMTIYRWEQKGLFPRRIHFGPNRIGWKLSEVMAWLDAQAAKREAVGAE